MRGGAVGRGGVLGVLSTGALAAAVLVGCARSGEGGSTGGSDAASIAGPATTAPAGSRLTGPQAAALAQTLFTNYDNGGATIDVTIPYGPAATFRLTGDIDWKTHRGRGRLETQYRDGRPSQTNELAWTPDAIAVTDPATGAWSVHRADPDKASLDRVLRLVDSLSSDRPENAQLLRQSDAVFLRNETVDGTELEVFRVGPRTTYWIEPDTGRMHRAQADFNGFAAPVTVGLTAPGPRTVVLPAELSAPAATGPSAPTGTG